jgi:hypothetical protein
MKPPTLDAFIVQALSSWPHNAWVREPGFASLYVRISKRTISGETRTVLDLASMEAKKPGKGNLTKLVTRLREAYPDLPLYVECVVNPRLPTMLVDRLGFTPDPNSPDSFYLT